MTIKSGAAVGDHTLTISQLATAQKVAGTSQSSQTDELGYSGTFSIGLEGGSTADISVTSTMSLQDIVDTINAQTSTTNVQASIVQVSSGSYEMVLTGTEDAADISYSSTSGDDILNKLGVTDSSGSFADVLQEAQAAEFTLDGIAMSRDTNDISDVLSGVTFSLLQETPDGATLNISIETDTSQIESTLETFVTNYNAFRDEVIAQQATDNGRHGVLERGAVRRRNHARDHGSAPGCAQQHRGRHDHGRSRIVLQREQRARARHLARCRTS